MENPINIKDPKFISLFEQKKVLKNQYLASYFTGFLEGDGCIFVPKNDNTQKRSKNILITFAFSKDDLPFAEFLQAKFNMGNIHIIKNENWCTWTIHKESDVLQLLIFCNGYFKTPKIGIFSNVLNYYKEKHNIIIPLLPLNTTPILEDGWFSGFSEADGSFLINYTKSHINTISVNLAYALEVAEIYSKPIDTTLSPQTNKLFMSHIANTFGVNLNRSVRAATLHSKETSAIKLTVTRTIDNIPMLINYFYKFPLFSSKYLNFMDWSSVIVKKLEIKIKDLKISDHIEEFNNIRNNFNSKRTIYNWEHLNNFYEIPENFPKKIELKFKNGRKS